MHRSVYNNSNRIGCVTKTTTTTTALAVVSAMPQQSVGGFWAQRVHKNYSRGLPVSH